MAEESDAPSGGLEATQEEVDEALAEIENEDDDILIPEN